MDGNAPASRPWASMPLRRPPHHGNHARAEEPPRLHAFPLAFTRKQVIFAARNGKNRLRFPWKAAAVAGQSARASPLSPKEKNKPTKPHIMRKALLVLCALVALSSCRERDRFTVQGTIEGLDGGQKIYLEHESLEGIVPVDSAEADDGGHYRLGGQHPGAPEFYRLRVGTEVVHFCVDSCEEITISGKFPGLGTGYSVEGSENSLKIREIALKQGAVQSLVSTLSTAVREGRMDVRLAADSMRNAILRHKADMRLNYIFADPQKPYAYYALFQQIDGILLFNVESEEDITLFQAVGTCWDTFWPQSVRTQNLHNYTMKGLQNIRILQARQQQRIPAEKIQEAGLIEINLPDKHGIQQSLSALGGNVVLLDFTLQEASYSPAHNLFLRGLYNRYHGQGLEIYQVSEDKDQHYWRTVTDALPWICVLESVSDPGAVASNYNVRELPTVFLISRESELQARYTDHESLKQAVDEIFR